MADTNTTPGYLYTGDFEDKVYGCTALEKHTSGYKLIQLKSISIDSDTVSYEDMRELMYAIDDGKFFTVDICGDIYSHVSAFLNGSTLLIPIGLSEDSESIEDAIAIIVISSGGSSPKSSVYISDGGPSYSDGQLHCIFNPTKYAPSLNANWHLRVFIEDVPAKDSSDWKLIDDRKNPYVNQINSRLSDKTAEVTELNRQIKELNTKMNKLYITDFSHFCEEGRRIYSINPEITSHGTNFSYMYYKCVQSPVPDLDTSKGTDFRYMFYMCTGITAIKITNTSKGKNFSNMFYACKKLTSIPNIDTSNGTNLEYMFHECELITSIPDLNTSNSTNFNNMFSACRKLTSIPDLDTSKGTNFVAMFSGCKALTSIPDLDVSKGEDFSSMFYSCNALTTVPNLDTSNGTKFFYMFNGCDVLVSVSGLDLSNGTNLNSMFNSCKALTNLKIKNIKISLEIGSGTTWGHLLTLESLLFVIGELITATSSQTLTVGSANLEKLANVYVKTIAITDEMRAADVNIDAKLPFEVCESTDEGASTISDYLTLKNWLIK